MSAAPVFNQCRTPIVIGKLYDHIRPPQSSSALCKSNDVVEEVEVVALQQAGAQFFALFRRCGENVNWEGPWIDIDYLRLRPKLCV